ncbi:MAG TPA: AAA family ATPase [Streptosporangiaceae bacterium]
MPESSSQKVKPGLEESLEEHPDLQGEQKHIDDSYVALERMRRRAVDIQDMGFMGVVYADGMTADKELFEIRDQNRVLALTDNSTPLCFGRLDHDTGHRHYIGRRHVEDDGRILVTDWRAAVATPFYRATVANTMGTALRRRFILNGRALLDIFDEDLASPTEETAAALVPDPFIVQLGRRRTGEMQDIVATIQAEQDVIIRSPMDRCVIVQGGPGTGKTAVGLHRAAYLLYERRASARQDRFLIVGPNALFLSYISQVLPSLGETSAIQKTISKVGQGEFVIAGEDTRETAKVKGDPRMLGVLDRAVKNYSTLPDVDLSVRTIFGTTTVLQGQAAAIIHEVAARPLPWNVARDGVNVQLLKAAWDDRGDYSNRFSGDRLDFERAILASREYRSYLNMLWPRLQATSVLRKLYRSSRTLALAAGDILSSDEQKLLSRKSSKLDSDTWTECDVPLLDELNFILSGKPKDSYTHIVVDEAQDLSALQLRMLGRRSSNGSMTVLGDLAQATGPVAQESWDEAARSLGVDGNYDIDHLNIGYRLPSSILNFANRLLPTAAPAVRPSESVRRAGEAPELIRVPAADRITHLVETVKGSVQAWSSIALVAPPSLMDQVAGSLAGEFRINDSRLSLELTEQVTLTTASRAKGLEFDLVAVLEPGAIGAEEGMRALYVALTRAVQRVVIVHSDELPAALAHPGNTRGSASER